MREVNQVIFAACLVAAGASSSTYTASAIVKHAIDLYEAAMKYVQDGQDTDEKPA